MSKKNKAVELYKEGKVSLSGAAERAGVDIYEMISLLIEAGIKSDCSLEDMKKERETLERLMEK
ncbi:MAG: UPF0175 family protein [Candidatus Aenigmarchaeota archaeon]|nr:UPF0175 family protein [Candidatus Aenigmarchaeota archaeon]